MKNLLVLMMACAIAASASGCGRRCKEAREQILQPSAAVSAYLQANPSGQNLADAGCTYVLQQFANLPAGAQTIRAIADQRFTDTYTNCISWATSVHYVCHTWPGPYGHPQTVCTPETYQYCAQYDYHTVYEPGYQQAMDLARNLDVTYQKTQVMCDAAFHGRLDEAYSDSRDLSSFLQVNLRPEENNVYAMACGS